MVDKNEWPGYIDAEHKTCYNKTRTSLVHKEACLKESINRITPLSYQLAPAMYIYLNIFDYQNKICQGLLCFDHVVCRV
jgi:hypothetical protein